MPKRLALLVGIDHYLDGDQVTIDDLRGCVNDVNIMSDLLQRFGFEAPTHLTSPPSNHSGAEDGAPTLQNIITKLEEILGGADEDDTFFFHYSGHGARLKSTKEPRGERKDDPSLLPMDYCSSEQALRGWELDLILAKFDNKKVHVIVNLDSCHSGGAYRTDSTIRSPQNWIKPQKSDQDMARGFPNASDYRHAKLESSWDINPERLVVMAACQVDQVARETSYRSRHGIFTYELCRYLTRWDIDYRPTYQTIRDHIHHNMPSEQTPVVFGRDKLVFLETKETFLAAIVQATVNSQQAKIPIGKVHGVKVGAVFISRWGIPDVLLKIEQVDDLHSVGSLNCELNTIPEFLPFQWYPEASTEVLVDADLGVEFRTALQHGLQEGIASMVLVREETHPLSEAEVIRFQLRTTDNDGINIIGPESLGCEGPAWWLRTLGESIQEKATKSADALAHLFRFTQVHSLRNEISTDTPNFRVTLDSTSSPDAPLAEHRKVKYEFENNDSCDLYFTVLDLGPGFHVGQMFPKQDGPQQVHPNAKRSFSFNLTLPSELQHARQSYESPHRDIIRTVVTRDCQTSLKSVELPDIWNATAMHCGRRSLGRGGDNEHFHLGSDFAWWIEDKEVYTKRQPVG
ncbi:hypothetical protein PG984_002750 [Apiospora sp. TS-2023a]